MTSIRGKLFLQIGLLIATMIALMMVVNTAFAEPYYMQRQRQMMIQIYQQIDALDLREPDEATRAMTSIIQLTDLDILILDEDENLLFATVGYEDDDRVNGGSAEGPLPNLVIDDVEVLDGGVIISRNVEARFNIVNLVLSGPLTNGTYLELRVPVHYIQTGITIINEILLFTGILFILISMGFAFLLSNRFTRPILAISEAAEKMQALDFDVHCDESADDELGRLSANINRMSDNLSEAMETLHIRDEKRRILLNNVSHELKTPLTLMQGYAVALKKNVVSNPEKTDFYTGVIIDETLKMNRLVEALLDIDQLETEKRQLNLRTFDINDFVSETNRKFEPLMDEKSIHHSLNLISPTLVQCDPDLTEQVLKNLLSNAILHIGQNRTLSVTLQPKDTSIRVCITNATDDLAAEDLDKLWDRFYKKDKARTRDQGGHGLGISIVKAIQEAHHQPYGVELVNQGVCFWFEICRSHRH